MNIIHLLALPLGLTFLGIVAPPADAPRIGDTLAEADVSLDRLQSLFETASFDVSRTTLGGEPGLLVEANGLRSVVLIDQDQKMIYFSALYRFRSDASRRTELELVNDLNNSIVQARFSVVRGDDADVLWADYHLSYGGGVPSHQILRSFRKFTSGVRNGLLAKDDEDLVL